MSAVSHKVSYKYYDILVNLSGGIDSCFAAYKYLKDGKTVLLHHCLLKNFQNRWPKEKLAVERFIKFLMASELMNFDYIETCFDYGGNVTMIHDIEVIGFMTGTILRNQKIKVGAISITASKDDVSQPTYRSRSDRRYQIIRQVAGFIPQYDYPIIEMRRREIIRDMPKELRDITWFCRTPRADGTPCGKCATCRQTLKHLLEEVEV